MRAAIAQIKQASAPLDSVYLRTLRNGEMTRERFVASQSQFFWAVAFFKKPMRALATRVDDAAAATLMANVRDEEGAGDPGRSHERTFIELLGRLGLPEQAVRTRPAGAAVTRFNEALSSSCASGPIPAALSMLGMIEDLFSDIALDVGRSIVSRGWLPEERVVHYPVHAEIDVAHAEGFYRHAQRWWPEHRAEIRGGLEAGAGCFLQLYEALAGGS